MLKAIIQLDYSERDYINEVLTIGSVTQIFKSEELKRMAFNDFEYILNRVRDEIKEAKNGEQ